MKKKIIIFTRKELKLLNLKRKNNYYIINEQTYNKKKNIQKLH